MVVRRDLPIGFLAAQVVHAAGESVESRVPANTNAVVLAVDDEPSLSGIEECLKAAGVEHVAIREPDPPWFGALTAIGMLTDDRKKLKSVVGKLPLLGAA